MPEHGSNGDLLVADRSLRQLTRLDADVKYLGTIRLPGNPVDFALLPNGNVLVNSSIGTRAQIGHPFHELRLDGSVVRSFGYEGQAVAPGGDSGDRFFSVTGSSLWSVPLRRYEIEEWSLQGEKRRTLVRNAPWFVATTTPPAGGVESQRPNPAIVGLQVDHRGYLYVFLAVPDANWRASAARPPTPGSQRGDTTRGGVSTPTSAMTWVEHEDYLDALIEIIDPSRGVLLAARRVSTLLRPSSEPGLARM